ncbi:MAG: hypothetical protein RR645_06325 [Clostridium sp.]
MYITFNSMVLFLFLLCFIVITVFLSIALYRLIKTLKSIHMAIEENRAHVNTSLKSVSGIFGKVEGVGNKLSSKLEDAEIESFIPIYMPYITSAISLIISIFNIFKSKKEEKS